MKPPSPEQLRVSEARCLSIPELKALWDGFDGDAHEGDAGHFWPSRGPHIEDVHQVLNERGEGNYCAV